MPILFRTSLMIFTLLALLLAPSVGGAQDRQEVEPPQERSDWDIRIGAGAQYEPTFEGSDRYHLHPIPLIRITYKDMISLDTKGLSAYWHNENLRVGAGLTYAAGRSNDEDGEFLHDGDDQLEGMDDIDPAVGIRAFASYHLWIADLSTSVTKYLGDDNDGTLVDLGLAVPVEVTDKLTLKPHVGATWADESYMQTFFGVTSAEAGRSELSEYDAGAGVKNVVAGVDAVYRLGHHWSIKMRGDVKQLLGDAKDSPVSFSDTGVEVGAMVIYRF